MRLFHRILVATDFSEGGSRALDLGAELAATFAAPLLVLHTFQTTALLDDSGRWPSHRADPGPLRTELEGELAGCRTRARDHHVRDVELALVEGAEAETIVRVARERGCDLIAVGPGEIAEKVVGAAACPVLVAGRA